MHFDTFKQNKISRFEKQENDSTGHECFNKNASILEIMHKISGNL